jgi:hypothetical protein
MYVHVPPGILWTATVQKSMDKISRGRASLETIQPGWSQKKKQKKRGKQ